MEIMMNTYLQDEIRNVAVIEGNSDTKLCKIDDYNKNSMNNAPQLLHK